MKKKGLIISTVVMVVVLIASLTTATYAWFTTSSSVTVDQINLSVQSNTAVKVGVHTTLTDTSVNGYHYGDLAVLADASDNDVAWDTAAATGGLGNVLTFNSLVLGGDMAVGTANAANSTATVDTTTNILSETQTIIKAKGDGTTVDKDSIAVAVANKDYLNATIGVSAAQAGLKGLYVKVVVTTTGAGLTLDINASVHFVIVVDGEYINFEPFGTHKFNETKQAVGGSTEKGLSYAGGQAVSTFYFWVAKTTETAGFAHDDTDIHDFQIYAYIDGADTDCRRESQGGCTIDISFDGTTDTTKLSVAEEEAPISTVNFLTLVPLNN